MASPGALPDSCVSEPFAYSMPGGAAGTGAACPAGKRQARAARPHRELRHMLCQFRHSMRDALRDRQHTRARQSHDAPQRTPPRVFIGVRRGAYWVRPAFLQRPRAEGFAMTQTEQVFTDDRSRRAPRRHAATLVPGRRLAPGASTRRRAQERHADGRQRGGPSRRGRVASPGSGGVMYCSSSW